MEFPDFGLVEEQNVTPSPPLHFERGWIVLSHQHSGFGFEQCMQMQRQVRERKNRKEKCSLGLMVYIFSEFLPTSSSCAESRGNFAPGEADSQISRSMSFVMKRGALSLISWIATITWNTVMGFSATISNSSAHSDFLPHIFSLSILPLTNKSPLSALTLKKSSALTRSFRAGNSWTLSFTSLARFPTLEPLASSSGITYWMCWEMAPQNKDSRKRNST